MQYLISIIYALISTSAFAIFDHTRLVPGDNAYITTQKGLGLRLGPNMKTGKVAVIPYGTKLKILSFASNNSVAVNNNIWGRWAKVRYKGKTGYVFSGYLTRKIYINESGISVSADGHKCKGIISSKVRLTDIGITAGQLKMGIKCVAGDFDGNGYLDFLLFGKKEKRTDPRYLAYSNGYLAVFYNRRAIIRQLHLNQNKYKNIDPVLYPSVNTSDEFGRPISKTDGYLDPGEGGTTKIYLYNPKTNKFDMSKHASENSDETDYILLEDQSDKVAGLKEFRRKLIKAIKLKDSKYILSVLDPRIRNHASGVIGINQFINIWHPDRSDSTLWRELSTLLILGGTTNLNKTVFYAPFVYRFDPKKYKDYVFKINEIGMLTATNVTVREKPNVNSQEIARLSKTTVNVKNWKTIKDTDTKSANQWIKMKTNYGIKGYVAKQNISSLTRYRAEFTKTKGQWKISYLAPWKQLR